MTDLNINSPTFTINQKKIDQAKVSKDSKVVASFNEYTEATNLFEKAKIQFATVQSTSSSSSPSFGQDLGLNLSSNKPTNNGSGTSDINDQKISSISQTIDTFNREAAEDRKQIQDSTQQINGLNTGIQEGEQKISNKQSQYNTAIQQTEANQSKKSGLLSRIDNDDQMMAQINEQIQSKQKVNELDNQIESINSDQDKLIGQITGNNSQISANKTQIATLQKQGGAQFQIEQLEKKNAELEAENKTITEKKDKNSKDIDNLTKQKAVIRVGDKSLDQLYQEYSKYENDKSAAVQELSEIDKKDQANKLIIEDFEKLKTDTDNKNKELTSQKEKLSTQKAIYENKIDSIESEIDKKQIDIQNLKVDKSQKEDATNQDQPNEYKVSVETKSETQTTDKQNFKLEKDTKMPKGFLQAKSNLEFATAKRELSYLKLEDLVN